MKMLHSARWLIFNLILGLVLGLVLSSLASWLAESRTLIDVRLAPMSGAEADIS
jgi:hypothetical protein